MIYISFEGDFLVFFQGDLTVSDLVTNMFHFQKWDKTVCMCI